jgi:predicted transglutaminase-like cysteine proteinase
VRGDEPERIVLDQATWSLIEEINDAVNDAIVPLKDIDHWGVEDVWGFPDDGVGDCEDYQLLKRRRLEEAGLPRRAMRMTVVIDDVGEGHAVLSILTDRGDLVLDNKRGHANALPPVLHAFDTGYRYIKREGSVPGPDGGPWVALGPDPSPAAVAVAAAGAPAP